MHSRIFCSIPASTYASSTPLPVATAKMSPDLALAMSSRRQHHPPLRTTRLEEGGDLEIFLEVQRSHRFLYNRVKDIRKCHSQSLA